MSSFITRNYLSGREGEKGLKKCLILYVLTKHDYTLTKHDYTLNKHDIFLILLNFTSNNRFWSIKHFVKKILLSSLPARASEQGKVISLVFVCIYIYIRMCVQKNCNLVN